MILLIIRTKYVFSIDQVTDLNYLLCDMQDEYDVELAKRLHMHGLDHSQDIIKAFSTTDAKWPDTRQQSMFEEVGSRKVEEDGHSLIILDCCHWKKVVELLEAEHQISWTNRPPLLLLAMH